ncbi:MAG: exodeoxyribonuclease III [Rhodospirillales bacterium]|nr:exodeoxyribonuclease III [Rhodospirillales bacterium]
MPDITLATWNINSVRLRIEAVVAYLKDHQPDILCLQEIKATENVFPFEPLREAGWEHIAVAGFKGYNGVATISRVPFMKSGVTNWCGREDGRHVWTVFKGSVELHNFYVPAGGDEPDPEINDKFAHKLQFLDEMTGWCADMATPRAKRIIVGDLNIAPLENDVWNHKQLLKVVSHTPVEVEAMERLRRAHDWIDAVRHFKPEPEKLYSWWSYRAKDWAAADRGRRLDHIWVTPALQKKLKSAEIHRHVRGWERASDHCPVSVTLDLPV